MRSRIECQPGLSSKYEGGECTAGEVAGGKRVRVFDLRECGRFEEGVFGGYRYRFGASVSNWGICSSVDSIDRN